MHLAMMTSGERHSELVADLGRVLVIKQTADDVRDQAWPLGAL
jgi:hypothetical protein